MFEDKFTWKDGEFTVELPRREKRDDTFSLVDLIEKFSANPCGDGGDTRGFHKGNTCASGGDSDFDFAVDRKNAERPEKEDSDFDFSAGKSEAAVEKPGEPSWGVDRPDHDEAWYRAQSRTVKTLPVVTAKDPGTGHIVSYDISVKENSKLLMREGEARYVVSERRRWEGGDETEWMRSSRSLDKMEAWAARRHAMLSGRDKSKSENFSAIGLIEHFAANPCGDGGSEKGFHEGNTCASGGDAVSSGVAGRIAGIAKKYDAPIRFESGPANAKEAAAAAKAKKSNRHMLIYETHPKVSRDGDSWKIGGETVCRVVPEKAGYAVLESDVEGQFDVIDHTYKDKEKAVRNAERIVAEAAAYLRNKSREASYPKNIDKHLDEEEKGWGDGWAKNKDAPSRTLHDRLHEGATFVYRLATAGGDESEKFSLADMIERFAANS